MKIIDFNTEHIAAAELLARENYQEEKEVVSCLPELREQPGLWEQSGCGAPSSCHCPVYWQKDACQYCVSLVR